MAIETIQHAIAVARRDTYRIIYQIDEAKRVVEIHSIRHRRDAYRS